MFHLRVVIFESCVVDLSLSRGRQIASGLTFLSSLPFPLQSPEHGKGVSTSRLPVLCSVGFCLACPRLLKTCSSPLFCGATLSQRRAHVLELRHPIGGLSLHQRVLSSLLDLSVESRDSPRSKFCFKITAYAQPSAHKHQLSVSRYQA